MARPTIYTPELADLICERIATKLVGTRRLCQKYDDMPDETCVYKWRYKFPEFAHKYAQAKMRQAEIIAEDILDIADDDCNDVKIDPDTGEQICNTEYIARSRLRVDTRKWIASKLAPKIYGDRQVIEQTIKHEENIEDLK